MSNADEFFRAMGIPRYEEDEVPQPAPKRAHPPLDELEELRSEVAALQRQFARGPDPAAHHSGQDGSRTVRVTVGGDGRVIDVALDRSWRTVLGPSDLGAAVLAAVGDAQLRRLAAWSVATAREELPEGTDAVPLPAQVGPGAPADSAGARRAVAELLSLLEGVDAELDDLDRRLNERATQQVVGRSPSHQVTVRMGGGGEVTDVEVQRRLVERSDDLRLAREVRSAFDDAYGRAGSLGLDTALGSGRLAELHALGSDPAALLRRLGFGRR